MNCWITQQYHPTCATSLVLPILTQKQWYSYLSGLLHRVSGE